ncbi:hypothetical protein QKW52_06725 [Bacillus sonorensis]|nr:hypothetical protein [Bacillus sonorensis]
MAEKFLHFSLFRPGEIVGGNADVLQTALMLAAIGLAAFAAGIAAFKQRDLPL